MRESKRTRGAGQAPAKSAKSALIITVDDAQGSRENSKYARMDGTRYSGISRGQEEIFSCVQLIGLQQERFSLVHS
jgi:hypothetical protein